MKGFQQMVKAVMTPDCIFCNHQAQSFGELEAHVWEKHSSNLLGE